MQLLIIFSFTLLCLFWFCFWSSLKRGRVHEKNKTKYYLVRVLSCWIFVGACVKAIYRLEDGLNWNESFGRRRKPNDSRRPTISLFLFPLISFEMKSNEEKNAHLFRSLFCMQKDACRLYCVIVFLFFSFQDEQHGTRSLNFMWGKTLLLFRWHHHHCHENANRKKRNTCKRTEEKIPALNWKWALSCPVHFLV